MKWNDYAVMKNGTDGFHIDKIAIFLIQIGNLWVGNGSKRHLLIKTILRLARPMLMYSRQFSTCLHQETFYEILMPSNQRWATLLRVLYSTVHVESPLQFRLHDETVAPTVWVDFDVCMCSLSCWKSHPSIHLSINLPSVRGYQILG